MNLMLWSLTSHAIIMWLLTEISWKRWVLMNLNYSDLSIEWLGNTARMDSLNTPALSASEIESHLCISIWLWQWRLNWFRGSLCLSYAGCQIRESKRIKTLFTLASNPTNVNWEKNITNIHTCDKLCDDVLKKYPGQPTHAYWFATRD